MNAPLGRSTYYLAVMRAVAQAEVTLMRAVLVIVQESYRCHRERWELEGF